VEERIDWMLDHPPGVSGMCARETWQAIGGDQNPPNPPAWGCANANEVYDKVKASGRYWTSTPIPRGAAIYWKYGNNGHASLSYGDGKIVTTDPTGDPYGTGVEDITHPHQWGATSSARIWTDQFNGVRFDVGEDDDMPTVDEIWSHKIEDPETGEEVSARELLRRTRTVATQGRDAAREAADNTG
jgi:hypothetical protein